MNTLYLDTRQCRNPTIPYDATWILNSSVFNEGTSFVELCQAMFCNGVSAFTSSSNTIAWVEAADPTVLTITIPAGEYSGDTLADYLSDAMTTESAANGTTKTYTVTFDEDTLKLTFASNSTLAFQTIANDAYYALGITTLDGAVAASVVGDRFVRLDGPEYVDVTADFHGLDGVHTTGTTKLVLARIKLTVGYGGIVFYEPVYPDKKRLRRMLNHAEIRMTLRDPNGNSFALPDNCPVTYVLRTT